MRVAKNKKTPASAGVFCSEGPTGIEPAFFAWEANVLPLDDDPETGSGAGAAPTIAVRSGASRTPEIEVKLLADGSLAQLGNLLVDRPRQLGADALFRRDSSDLERQCLDESGASRRVVDGDND